MNAGDQLGPYRIEALIGAGGMGAVYKARDTRLDRTVAIKTVEGRFSERFEREAKTIASLNHPHICTLFDVGENYLVMEYIEGATLKGPLPLADVIKYGAQIAEALDAAHRKGITHRDLKPGNILITKAGAKVIDFGLAKAAPVARTDNDLTLTKALTGEGTILGTVPYMSPEQLQGQEADARSDIFALGCVLYEMVTGKRAFDGKSQVSIMAAILEHEPAPLSESVVPAWLDRVIRRCLRKSPDERWQNARDVAIELKEPHAASKAPVARTSRLVWAAMAALVIAAAGFAWQAFHPAIPPRLNAWLAVPLPDGATLERIQPIAPDGRYLAIAARRTGQTLLYVRLLDGPNWRALVGTEGADRAFWSPDSRHLGFTTADKMKRIDLASGQVRVLCDLVGTRSSSDVHWAPGGTIIFRPMGSDGPSQVYSLPETGGLPKPLFASEGLGFWFTLLPDGTLLGSRKDELLVYSLNDGKSRVIGKMATSNFTFVPGEGGQGHILHGEGTRLLARPFDSRRLAFTGDDVPVIDGIFTRFNANDYRFAASGQGILAYAPADSLLRKMTWVDRSGRAGASFGEPAEYDFLRLSPDGRRVAYSVRDADTGSFRAFTSDVDGSRVLPLSAGPLTLAHTWSPDGTRIASRESDTVASRNIGWLTIRPATGTTGSQERLLADGNRSPAVTDWSPDGKYLLFTEQRSKSPDLWVLPLAPIAAPIPVARTEAEEFDGAFSPDGHYIAYRFGRGVQLKRFPVTDETWSLAVQIVDTSILRWRGDGRELYFDTTEEGKTKLMVVPVRLDGPRPEFGEPKVLFAVPASGARWPFDVSRDGQRFLMVTPVAKTSATVIHVLTNWRALLDQPAQAR